MHRHLRRLERVWIDAPMYFVTTCTKNRNTVLARNEVAEILLEEWRGARDRHGWAVGRYVIMPDHVHFFCRPELDRSEEHTSELQSRLHLVCRLLLEKKKNI